MKSKGVKERVRNVGEKVRVIQLTIEGGKKGLNGLGGERW